MFDRKEYGIQWRELNKDTIKINSKYYYLEHRATMLEYYTNIYRINRTNPEYRSHRLKLSRLWEIKNKETRAKAKREFYLNNQSKIKNESKKWRENHPNYLKEYCKKYRLRKKIFGMFKENKKE